MYDMSRARLLCSVFLVHVCSAVASEKEPFSIREGDEKATKCGLDDFEIDTLAKYVIQVFGHSTLKSVQSPR